MDGTGVEVFDEVFDEPCDLLELDREDFAVALAAFINPFDPFIERGMALYFMVC